MLLRNPFIVMIKTIHYYRLFSHYLRMANPSVVVDPGAAIAYAKFSTINSEALRVFPASNIPAVLYYTNFPVVPVVTSMNPAVAAPEVIVVKEKPIDIIPGVVLLHGSYYQLEIFFMYHFISLKVDTPRIPALIKSDICLVGNCSTIDKSVGIPVGLDYPDLWVVDASDNFQSVICTVAYINYILVDYRKS